MRILITIALDDVGDDAIAFAGSAEHWLLPLVRQLAPRGHEIEIAHDPRSAIAELAVEGGAVSTWALPRGPGARVAAAVRVARVVRRRSHEVVLSTSRFDLVPAGTGARLAGLPGTVARLDRGWSADDPVLRSGGKRHRHRWYHRRLVSLAVTSSEAGKADLVERGYLPADRIQVIHDGVDLERFDPARIPAGRFRETLGIPAQAALVVSIARYAPGRAREAEVDAAGALVSRDPDLHFVFAGSCRPEDRPFRERLVLRSRTFRGGARIRFLERQEDLPAILKDADVLVRVLSTEGLANVALEALAMEVPVVIGDIAGMPEAVEEEATGHLVRPGDAGGISAAVERLLSLSEGRRREMGRRGRARIRQRFSIETMADRYEDLFQRARS
ncbi:MAG: glycosyltransferase family 4 protein [Gemmatimonadota bacterium]